MKTNKYQTGKARVINEALEWEEWTYNNAVSWEGIVIALNYFERMAKRYGLIREFRENGII